MQEPDIKTLEIEEPEINREIYTAIPVPTGDEEFWVSVKYACCQARAPYVTMLVARLAFQGFIYDTILLVARGTTATQIATGAVGLIAGLFWIWSHYYLGDII